MKFMYAENILEYQLFKESDQNPELCIKKTIYVYDTHGYVTKLFEETSALLMRCREIGAVCSKGVVHSFKTFVQTKSLERCVHYNNRLILQYLRKLLAEPEYTKGAVLIGQSDGTGHIASPDEVRMLAQFSCSTEVFRVQLHSTKNITFEMEDTEHSCAETL